jgi:UPF0716 protein FxsA
MRIFPIGLTVFILVPIIEIYLFIKVGSAIGALATVALVFLTAMIGVYLLRQQGLSTLNQVQAQMQRGEIPATSLFEGMLLFIAGVLLLTPGFMTDSIGFVLMIPPLRKVIALWILEHSGWIVQMQAHTVRKGQYQDSSHTLEGEYRHRDE